jgi:hypothetical protein
LEILLLEVTVDIGSLSQIKKIGLQIIIKYFDEMIRGFSNREHLSPLIKRLEKRILDLEKVLTIEDPESNKENRCSLFEKPLIISSKYFMIICSPIFFI